jgi:hypothetical protein
VTYACAIIVKLFNEKGDDIIGAWKGISSDFLEEKNKVDFDYWLAGFNDDLA